MAEQRRRQDQREATSESERAVTIAPSLLSRVDSAGRHPSTNELEVKGTEGGNYPHYQYSSPFTRQSTSPITRSAGSTCSQDPSVVRPKDRNAERAEADSRAVIFSKRSRTVISAEGDIFSESESSEAADSERKKLRRE